MSFLVYLPPSACLPLAFLALICHVHNGNIQMYWRYQLITPPLITIQLTSVSARRPAGQPATPSPSWALPPPPQPPSSILSMITQWVQRRVGNNGGLRSLSGDLNMLAISPIFANISWKAFKNPRNFYARIHHDGWHEKLLIKDSFQTGR